MPPLLLLCAIVMLGGCSASSIKRVHAARNAFAAGDLPETREQLQALSKADKKHAVSSELDLAMVDLADGNHRAAEQRLRILRDKFDDLPTVTPVREATSIVTDDMARLFRPAGYEEVMVRAMLAFCSLAGDGTDAESYSLQASMKQNKLSEAAAERGIENPTQYYQPIAIAPYLRGMIREATHRDYDDAARAYALVSNVQPDFAPAQADVQRATTGVHCSPGYGVLYVLACVGRGPVLTESVAPTTTEALKIASLVLQATQSKKERDEDKKAIVLPNVASVKVPTLVVPPSRVAAIDVHVDGQLYGTSQTVTDVSQLAANQLQAEMPWTIARAVVRRITKEATVARVSNSMGLQGNAQSLFNFAAASAWSGSEDADTRCWGLLPRELQVFRAELPIGNHELTLSAVGPNGHSFVQRNAKVEIVDGKNKYIIAIAPDEAIFIANESQ